MSHSITYYQNKNLKELLSLAQTNLKELKRINKTLNNSIEKFQTKDPTYEELQNLDKSWKKGYKCLQTLKTISMAVNKKEITKEKEIIEKMNSKITALKQEYQNSLKIIKNLNYIETERRSSLIEEEERKTENDLQQQLNIEEIITQESLIKDRSDNIIEINNAIKEVKNISDQIFNLTREDGEKLDNIIKKQEQHLDVVTNKVNVDLVKTEEFQGKMCWNAVLILGVFLAIAAVILAIYYFKGSQ